MISHIKSIKLVSEFLMVEIKDGQICYIFTVYLLLSNSGSVEGTKGDWIGIDWDDFNRGKHDGSHKEKKYFSTKTETSGSFVRATKISAGNFIS